MNVMSMSLTAADILNAQAHVGTLKNEAHPKTKEYRAWVVNDIVVIDPEKLLIQIETANKKIQQAKKDWKSILVVCEKKMYADELAEICEKNNINYLNYKVPWGFLTNFDTLKKRIESMNTMYNFIDSEDFHALTKKEQLVYKRKLNRVMKIYKWVKNLTSRPDLVVVIDGSMLPNFISELTKKKDIDNIIITGTDFNKRRNQDNLVFANMAGYKSIDFVLKSILS